MWYTKCTLAAPGKAAGQLVGFGVAATELGIIGWVSVWVSVWALQIYDSTILACDNNLDLMCVFMASGGIGFSSSVSVYNGFGLRNKLRDGPLHNEKEQGIFFSPSALQRASGKRTLLPTIDPNPHSHRGAGGVGTMVTLCYRL